MKARIELTEIELKSLVLDYLHKKLGDISFDEKDVKIQVKSKQNYSSEWESASYRAVLETFQLK